MDLLAGLFAFMIVPGAIVGAVLGWQALSKEATDTWRLKMAAWMVSAPWFGVILAGGSSEALRLLSPSVLGGALFVSPVVAFGMMTWWWWRRYQPRQSVPATVDAFRQGVAKAANAPALRPTASLADLRLPGPAASVLAVTLASFVVGVLMFPPWRRPSSEWDFGSMIFEILVAFGTLFVSVAAVLCAIAFTVRRMPVLAAAYSVLSLCVVIGDVNLLILGYWPAAARGADDHYGFAPVIVMSSIAALVPAMLVEMVQLARRRSELKDDFVDWLYRLTR